MGVLGILHAPNTPYLPSDKLTVGLHSLDRCIQALQQIIYINEIDSEDSTDIFPAISAA